MRGGTGFILLMSPYIVRKLLWLIFSSILVCRLYSYSVSMNAKSNSLYVSSLESMMECKYTTHPILFEALDSSRFIQFISCLFF